MTKSLNSDERRFDAATVVIFDPVAGNLNVTRSILNTIGFRHFEVAATLTELRQVVMSQTLDLIID